MSGGHLSDAPPVRTQEELEKRYIELMKELGPIWEATGRTRGGECFAVHLQYQITNAIEMLPVRLNPETAEVELLMFPRSPEVGPGNPPEYAGRLHSPGCMQMWGMNPRVGLDRVVAKETGVPYEIIGGLMVNPDVERSPRGWEMSLCYIVRLRGELPANSTGVWVPVWDLPRRYEQDTIIRAQYDSFLKLLVIWANEHRNDEISKPLDLTT
jgi:ADP-ribose pyrophosphatase YjhB (NUDIX family)